LSAAAARATHLQRGRSREWRDVSSLWESRCQEFDLFWRKLRLAHRREWVQQENGALFCYAADLASAGTVVARYIDDIFMGANPADLPAQRLDNIYFVLNADKVIE
jgi:hypothetical protein